jgi:hypothetical protein
MSDMCIQIPDKVPAPAKDIEEWLKVYIPTAIPANKAGGVQEFTAQCCRYIYLLH